MKAQQLPGWRWLAPAVAFSVALAVYLRTAAPGLTWAHDSADGGDLITAALVGGVPHPSGYPTFTLLARLFTRLPWGSPAWRVTLLSVLSGALATALVTAIVQDLGDTAQREPPGRLTRTLSLPALTAGLLLAFSSLLWSQATVAEVYALHACFAAALLWTLGRWRRTGHRGWALAAGMGLGLGLGNHVTIVALLPLAVTGLWLPQPWKDNSQGQRARSILATAGLAPFVAGLAGGLLVYAYLPLAAANDPPVNWGNPDTSAGFWWLVSGQLYRGYAFAVDGQGALARIGAFAALLWRDFWPWGLALALGGLGLGFRHNRPVTMGGLASLLLILAWAIGYDTVDSMLPLLAGWVVIAVWAGLGLVALARWLAGRGTWGWHALPLLCLAVAGLALAWSWQTHDLSGDRQAEAFVEYVLEAAQPGALILTAGDQATFSLWYARYGLGRRPDLAPIARDLWRLDSYRQTVHKAHPQLSGANPPADLAALTGSAIAQRPVYLAQRDAPAGPEAVGLAPDAPYMLLPVGLRAGPASPGLWELRPRPQKN